MMVKKDIKEATGIWKKKLQNIFQYQKFIQMRMSILR
jgi:hypothetical protein